MPFTHYTVVTLQSLAALVNSRRPESLATMADLDEYCLRWKWSGSRTRQPAELEQVRSVRDRMAGFWNADEEGVVVLLNALLAEATALPQLVKHDEFDWHIHATTADEPLSVRMTVDFAMAMVDVVMAGELDRLSRCAADDCDDVVIDLSKNRSRKFCDSGCGNRTNVAAYRARRRASG